jgi:cytochrome P450
VRSFIQEDGTAEPCFVTEILGSGFKTAEELDILKWSAASIYAGGADTTVSLLQTFFLVMTLFPDVQEKAQAEIDLVVGQNRLPKLSDRRALPFVDALLSECLRWGSVAPIALPHRLMEDDLYNGYLLPKGSIVLANIWYVVKFPRPPD